MRPRSFQEFVGQGHIVGEGKALTRILSRGDLPSIILWGPAGTGKTTLAHLLADAVGAQITQLSAVNSGVADARKVMEGSRGGLFRTVLFVDEVHRWSKAQQDVLLPAVEDGKVTLIGATTENPYFSLNTPLLSRCLLLRLEPLEDSAVEALLHRALEDPDRGLGGMGLGIDGDALAHLVSLAGGDARMALTGLEAAAQAAKAEGLETIPLSVVSDAVQKKAIVYDRQGDAHYDVISAFIKSIRGSDPDAALFWLARMIEAGEDPRFIARRLIVHASEDVGMADSQALLVAVAAAQAVEHVGLPEVRLNLAHATVYLATAPKSNSVYLAIGRAFDDAPGPEPVPLHLRDASYKGARSLGHGEGYRYPHDFPGHVVAQAYRPARFQGTVYYEPSGIGDDAARSHVPDPSTSDAQGLGDDEGGRVDSRPGERDG
jgi:putative ATPase